MGGRRALLLGAASTAFLAACRRAHRPPPPVTWLTDVDAADAEAHRTGRLLFVAFTAEWDTASKELDHVTFTDPSVMAILDEHFVAVRADCTNDEDDATAERLRRFRVYGTPTILVARPNRGVDLFRFTELVRPARLVLALRTALAGLVAASDVDAARVLGATRDVPVVMFFGPADRRESWWMRRETLTDPNVAALLRDRFVFVDVPADDRARDAWRRFDVTSPATVVIDAGGREIARTEHVMGPFLYELFLKDALARYRA